MEIPVKQEENRNLDGTFKPGYSGNPNGRPRGKSLKEYAREFYEVMSDDEKRAFLFKLEEKRPGFAWEMGEGKAKQDVDLKGEITSKVISVDE